jgi:SPP1 gp7 family putative phage head morphogenesis protein
VLNALRNGLSRFLPARSVQMKVDPNRPIALYFSPSGQVTPITMKSLSGWNGGEYDALNTSMNRRSSATASEIGYAYLSEVNVWIRRCMEIRADNIQRLEWYVEDKTTGRRIPGHALTRAMERTRHPLMWRVSRAYDTWGEVYIKPLKNEYGFYSDVWWLNNLSVNFNIVNGFIDTFYYAPLHGGKPDKWRTDEMCYLYNFNSFDDLRGSSRVLAVLHEANVHEEIARSAQAHFANDARPGIMFLPKNDLGVPQSEEFIAYWKENFQGSLNTNKPVILPMAIESVEVLERASLKDDVELRGSIRREICAGFGVPLSVAGAWDDASYQSAPEQRKSLYEETIIPDAELLARGLTTELLPFFGNPARERVWFDAKHLLALAEDKQAKAAALNSQLLSGGLTLNQYRQALDQEAIPQGNVFYVPSSVVVTPVEKLGTLPPPAPPSGGFGFSSAPPAVSVEKPVVPALPSGEEPAKAAGSCTMLLSLAGDTGLIQLQQALKQQLTDPAIQWTDPADFHITLVHIPAVDEHQVDTLLSDPAVYPGETMRLTVGSVASFDKVGRHALFFRIRENADLRACQRDVYTLAYDAGAKVSPFNEPGNWQPHVTMGYSPQRIPRVKVDTGLKVSPAELVVSVEQDGQRRDVYRGAIGQVQETVAPVAAVEEKVKGLPGSTETIEVIEPPPSAKFGSAFDGININGDEPGLPESYISNPVNPLLNELNQYEKFTLNRWGQPLRAFHFTVITDPLLSELTGQVKACTGKSQVRKLFEGLRAALKAPEEDDDADIVTPEQAQEWWGDYDRLMKRLGNDWLRDYMKEVWRKLESRLSREITADDVGALLADFHPDLIEKWTGTADDPGVIAKLFMAGMGAGQAALERKRTNMNPAKAAELNIDWNLVPADAIADVRKYVKQLIGTLDKTTLRDFEQVLVQWLESGGALEELKRQLTPVFNDPDRADLIAITEASNAYNNGAIQRWQDAGVEKMKFKTVQDSKVCPECKPLAGKIGTLDGGWGGVFIPVHPRCRCYASPVL